ncbi:MAG TPA: phosphomethylpyrimidine synthase ThiC, partial [Methylocella sp.]|nr:phosphomethylpyrimidine synthase ThiC [Methylocella sp.]
MNIYEKPQELVPQSVTCGPLPGSRRVYSQVQGHSDIAVPFREIVLDPLADEPPLRVYDTSGPYTEDGVSIDLSKGLAPIREPWLARREGLEIYCGRAVRPEDNGGVAVGRLVPPCPANRLPHKGCQDAPVTQYEFARAGIITEEMIFAAARENLGREKIADD